MYLRRLILQALAPSALVCLCGSIVPAEEGIIKVIPPRKRAVSAFSFPTASDRHSEDDKQPAPVRDLSPDEQNRVNKALEAFEGDSWKDKSQYLKKLKWLGEPAVPSLASELEFADEAPGCWILMALADIGGHAARAALFKTIEDGDGRIQLVALSHLENFNDKETAIELAKHTASEDKEIRSRAATALSRLGVPEALDPLIALLPDEDSGIALSARTGLLTLSRKRVVRNVARRVINFWKTSGAVPDENSFLLLGELADDSAVYYLNDLMEKNTNDCALFAASAMGTIGSRSAIRMLTRKVRRIRNDDKFRIAVIEALGGSRDTRDRYAIPALIDLLNDQNPDAATAATASLENITGLHFGLNPSRWIDWWTRELFQLPKQEYPE